MSITEEINKIRAAIEYDSSTPEHKVILNAGLTLLEGFLLNIEQIANAAQVQTDWRFQNWTSI